MSTFTLTDLEVVKEIPGNPQEKGGPAKIYKLSFKEDERQPEMFAVASTPIPKVGEKLEGEIEQGQFGLRWKRAGGRSGGGGGFKRSPAETKQIVRQHSEEMALRREANLIAGGQPPFTDDELRTVIDWFEGDAYGKKLTGVRIGPVTSDVPFDTQGLEEVPWP